jgi:hypothetical protein
MTDYAATPEEWASIDTKDTTIISCLLELRDRVEALEANSKPTPNPIQIRSSLVERVAEVFLTGTFNADDPVGARAAIREVAAWMRELECDYNAVRWLEQEAER